MSVPNVGHTGAYVTEKGGEGGKGRGRGERVGCGRERGGKESGDEEMERRKRREGRV